MNLFVDRFFLIIITFEVYEFGTMGQEYDDNHINQDIYDQQFSFEFNISFLQHLYANEDQK